MVWIHTTVPPVSRTACASRLMFGTISCAVGQSECATPGSMKAFCMSTTTSAVLRRIEIVVDVLAAAPCDDAIDDRLRNGDLVHQGLLMISGGGASWAGVGRT